MPSTVRPPHRQQSCALRKKRTRTLPCHGRAEVKVHVSDLSACANRATHVYLCRHTMAKPKVLTYEGCNFFRQRLVLATLSSRPVRITNIRANTEEPGLRGKLPRLCVCVCVVRSFLHGLWIASFCRIRGRIHSTSG